MNIPLLFQLFFGDGFSLRINTMGYFVEVAGDGAAVLAALKTGNLDALVSDVEIPRMTGFMLTERIRTDQRLSSLPIILATSLASQEDKERGITAIVFSVKTI